MAGSWNTIQLDNLPKDSKEELEVEIEGKEEEPEVEIEVDEQEEQPRKVETQKQDTPQNDDDEGESEEGSEEEASPEKRRYTRSQRLKFQRDEARKQLAKLQADSRKLAEIAQQSRAQAMQTRQQALMAIHGTLADQLDMAKAQYEQALSMGDPSEISQAQQKVTQLTIKLESLNNNMPPPQQQQPRPRQPQKVAPQRKRQPKQRDTALEDRLAQQFVSQNSDWWQKDEKKTQLALALDAQLRRQGLDPSSEDFYDELEDQLDKLSSQQPARKVSKTSPVGGAERGARRSGNRIVVTKEDQAMANRLGVSIEEYAKQKKAAMNTNANGYTSID